jgi:hypothetical protein
MPEQTEIINQAFKLISKDEVSVRELNLLYKNKKHVNDLWLIKLRLWENQIKNLNEQRKKSFIH